MFRKIIECYTFQAEIKHSFVNIRVYLLKECTSLRQDLDKLATNIPQWLEYGNFCKIISTPIKCILEELLSFWSVAFLWGQNV